MKLLKERAKTHGSFGTTAFIAQTLKAVLRAFPGFHKLSDEDREVIDMICVKIARIVSGKSRREHWEDIIGYARLAWGRCKK